MTNIDGSQPGSFSRPPASKTVRRQESEEPLPPDGFDPQFYLDRYADVAAAGIDPLSHYVNYGKKEGRSPNAEVEASKSVIYDVVASNFDRPYYLQRYPDVAAAGVDPVQHYLVDGAREGRNPSPDFVTSYYAERYPDVVESGLNPFYHYLTIGRPRGWGGSFFSQGEPAFEAMCEIVGFPSAVAVRELSARRGDLRSRLADGKLGEMVRRAGELEPLIHQSWLGAMEPRFPPFHSELVTGQVVGMHRLQMLAKHRRAKVVLAIRSCTVGGVQRIAGHLAYALSEIYAPDEVVVVATDKSAMQCRHWFPLECRVLDFAAEAEAGNARDKQRLLIEFIRSLRSSVVFNMNSELLWDAMAPYGKALSRSSAIAAYLFCNDLDVNGHAVGYPNRNFYRYHDVLTAVVTDSNFLADDLRTRFQIPPSDKLVVLNTPVELAIPLVPPPVEDAGRRRQVFWAGRFTRQKRVDIVAAIAERLPEVDFRLWGATKGEAAGLSLPTNVAVEGAYENFADLPLGQCDLWLYTSQWDGVPNMLFEVASTGIPLVSSLSGGCGEVLIEGLCERIAHVENVDAFVRSIGTVLADRAAARHRARMLRDRIRAERTPVAYRDAVAHLLKALPS